MEELDTSPPSETESELPLTSDTAPTGPAGMSFLFYM